MSERVLSELREPGSFWWAVGVEDTFLPARSPRTGRSLDLYALTGHYERWADDIDLMASLGVPVVRYGLPWPRINPALDRWDWDWSDRALDRLVSRGIRPIVDLVHYGTPEWLEGSFLHPDYPQRVADYAARAAHRYRGRVQLWTPLNEPRITAWHGGRTGVWPPYRRSWSGFVAVLFALTHGTIHTADALRAVDPANLLVHVDAANRWLRPDPPTDPQLQAQTEFRQELSFLALDLLTGQLNGDHRLRDWLARHGATEADVEWFAGRLPVLDVIGINFYPMLSQKQFVRTAPGRVRIRYPYADAAALGEVLSGYWHRYRRPLLLTETASRGHVRRRRAWLDESVTAVREVRTAGIPVVGYTWWPLFDLISWTYARGRKPFGDYLAPMGLWQLDPTTLDRRPTPLVEAYAGLVADGARPVGELARGEAVASVR
ncbi:MAG TPA: family 1 glycosylhydrolase [Propionibacteriaceae bacterium]|nr:family 1 glycosylhydrolase [Propionibacteriaceae bacterium]